MCTSGKSATNFQYSSPPPYAKFCFNNKLFRIRSHSCGTNCNSIIIVLAYKNYNNWMVGPGPCMA